MSERLGHAITLTEHELSEIRMLIHERTGISFDESRERFFSTRVQESKSKQNTTETRARQQVADRSEAWGTYLTGPAGVTGFSAIFCSRRHTQFLYQNRQNYPAQLFFAYAFRAMALQCVVG